MDTVLLSVRLGVPTKRPCQVQSWTLAFRQGEVFNRHYRLRNRGNWFTERAIRIREYSSDSLSPNPKGAHSFGRWPLPLLAVVRVSAPHYEIILSPPIKRSVVRLRCYSCGKKRITVRLQTASWISSSLWVLQT